MSRKLLSLLLLSLLASACQTVDDPRQGGLFDGLANLASGGYEKRIATRETALQDQQTTQTRLQGESVALQREHARLQQELAAAETRLERLEASIRTQRARLERERRLQAADRSRLRQQQARLRQAETSARTLRADLGQARRADQPVGDGNRQLQKIQQRLDSLNDLVNTLAGG